MARRLNFLLAVAIACSGWNTPAFAGCTESEEIDAIRRLELRGARVNVDGWDIDEARRFFAADFVSIQPDGRINGLDAVMATFKNGRSRGWAQSFDITSLDISLLDCAAAMVIGTAEVRALGAPAGAPPWRVRFLNVWRKSQEGWQYRANQFARMLE
jgi:ketosteroid isomerase-like protein